MVCYNIFIRLRRSKRITFYLLLSLVSLPAWIILTHLVLTAINVSLTEDKDLIPINPPNCSLLFKGDCDEIKRVKLSKDKHWTIPPEEQLLKKVSSCAWVIASFEGYYVSKKEKAFPLAFALNVYDSPQQILRFLQVIYRPHNVYCIHYDQKSVESFKKVMRSLADCLPNVIIPYKIEDVVRGWHTVVDAQMNCMSDLYRLRDLYPWKYVMTLCGKEVPLKTNWEMVQTLMKLNGTSSVGTFFSTKMESDYFWKFKHVLADGKAGRWAKVTNQSLGPVPYNLTVMKSLAYYSLSVSFVDFLLNDKRAIVFRKFMDQTHIPEEHFVATLFCMKGAPGGKDGLKKHMPYAAVSVIWMSDGKTDGCSGDNMHSICIVSSGDLHRLEFSYSPDNEYQPFFHNKFFLERDRVVMDCAEQELLRRNREEYYRDINNTHRSGVLETI